MLWSNVSSSEPALATAVALCRSHLAAPTIYPSGHTHVLLCNVSTV